MNNKNRTHLHHYSYQWHKELMVHMIANKQKKSEKTTTVNHVCMENYNVTDNFLFTHWMLLPFVRLRFFEKSFFISSKTCRRTSSVTSSWPPSTHCTRRRQSERRTAVTEPNHFLTVPSSHWKYLCVCVCDRVLGKGRVIPVQVPPRYTSYIVTSGCTRRRETTRVRRPYRLGGSCGVTQPHL